MGQDFSSGLKPEHAAGHTNLTRAGSDLSIRSGNKSPSLPASPISPRSPNMPRAFHSPTSSPLVGRRSMSPRRGGDYGFASAVSNIVDQAHYISEQERLKRFGIGTLCCSYSPSYFWITVLFVIQIIIWMRFYSLAVDFLFFCTNTEIHSNQELFALKINCTNNCYALLICSHRDFWYYL